LKKKGTAWLSWPLVTRLPFFVFLVFLGFFYFFFVYFFFLFAFFCARTPYFWHSFGILWHSLFFLFFVVLQFATVV